MTGIAYTNSSIWQDFMQSDPSEYFLRDAKGNQSGFCNYCPDDETRALL